MDLDPNDIARAIFLVLIGLAILTPVMGLTAYFALRPLVETFARMREKPGSSDEMRALERRVEGLEREARAVAALREQVTRLAEAQEFHLRLEAPVDAEPPR